MRSYLEFTHKTDNGGAARSEVGLGLGPYSVDVLLFDLAAAKAALWSLDV